jgi:hypothetical protein
VALVGFMEECCWKLSGSLPTRCYAEPVRDKLSVLMIFYAQMPDWVLSSHLKQRLSVHACTLPRCCPPPPASESPHPCWQQTGSPSLPALQPPR